MQNLNAAFSALSDPVRRAILTRLATGEATINELAAPFEISQPAISRHIKVLESAGLIVRRIEGTRRPCRLASAGIVEVDKWLGTLREALSRNYDRLDQVLASMQPDKGRSKRWKK
jgi:DNA-binding transcriptional ArsR family regulator